MTTTNDVQLSRQDVADVLGIKPTSVGTYMRRQRMPQPDGRIGRSPWWWRTTIDKWAAERPRSGYNPTTHADAPAKAREHREALAAASAAADKKARAAARKAKR